jgi:hypothetical protein
LERFEGGCRRLGGQLLLELREVCDFPVLGEFAVSDPVELKSREIDTIAGRLDLPNRLVMVADQNGDLLSAGAARGVRGAGKPSVISTDRMRSSKSVSRGDV